MSGTTAIEWTDRTWNPLTGCTKVSPGCDHCYAKTMHERFNGPGSFDTVTLHPERLGQPLRWRKPSMVFVNSMSDLFHDAVPDEYIARVFAVMALAQQHTFQLLTKRHGRMRSLLNDAEFWRAVGPHMSEIVGARTQIDNARALPNVWLGVSVETQQWADVRIPALLDTPAAVRFLSCEPLLGPVSLARAVQTESRTTHRGRRAADTGRDERSSSDGPGPALARVDWVIVGGESGRGARPMDVEWARSLRDQCTAAGVPFLFKQWGSHDEHGRRMSKHAAGRLLDGRTWDEYPERAA